MRVAILRFTKDYETVADGLATTLQNATTTRRIENERNVIDVEGDFEHFVLTDMDMWSAHIKFEIQDNSLQGDDDREARSILASAEPNFSAVLFSPTVAHVYKRVQYITRTTTIIERIENGEAVKMLDRIVEEDIIPQEEWVEITREFGQKVRLDP